MDEDRLYNHSLGEVHLQNLDIGIGMRHFAEAARCLGLPGRWEPLPATRGELADALNFGESRGWAPIALWR